MVKVLMMAVMMVCFNTEALCAPRTVFTIVAADGMMLPPSDPSTYTDGVLSLSSIPSVSPTIGPGGRVAFAINGVDFDRVDGGQTARGISGQWLWDPATGTYTVIRDGLSLITRLDGTSENGDVGLDCSALNLERRVFVGSQGKYAFVAANTIFTNFGTSNGMVEPVAQSGVVIPSLSPAKAGTADLQPFSIFIAVNDRGDILYPAREVPDPMGSSGAASAPIIRELTATGEGASNSVVTFRFSESVLEMKYLARISSDPVGPTAWTYAAYASTPSSLDPLVKASFVCSLDSGCTLTATPDQDKTVSLSISHSGILGAIFEQTGSASPSRIVGILSIDECGIAQQCTSETLIEDGITIVDGNTIVSSQSISVNSRGDVVVVCVINDNQGGGDRHAILVRRPGETALHILVDSAVLAPSGGSGPFIYTMLDGRGNVIFYLDRDIWFVDSEAHIFRVYDDDASIVAYASGEDTVIGDDSDPQVVLDSIVAADPYGQASTEDGRPRWITHDTLEASFAIGLRGSECFYVQPYVLHADIYPCSADLNKDGIVDLSDQTRWVTLYQALDPIADFAEPYGIWDLGDVTAWVSAFSAGCP